VRSARSWQGRRPALRWRATTAALFLVQPIARLAGRLGYGLTPWRSPPDVAFAFPAPRNVELWSEEWRPADEWLRAVEGRLAAGGVAAVRGGDYDRWDLRVRGGMLACARLRHVIEEHGAGRQLARFRVMPALSRLAVVAIAILAALGLDAVVDGADLAAAALLSLTAAACALALREAAWAAGALLAATDTRPAEPVTEEKGLDAALLAVAETANLTRVASKEST
jgi:hypothetical protein